MQACRGCHERRCSVDSFLPITNRVLCEHLEGAYLWSWKKLQSALHYFTWCVPQASCAASAMRWSVRLLPPRCAHWRRRPVAAPCSASCRARARWGCSDVSEPGWEQMTLTPV